MAIFLLRIKRSGVFYFFLFFVSKKTKNKIQKLCTVWYDPVSSSTYSSGCQVGEVPTRRYDDPQLIIIFLIYPHDEQAVNKYDSIWFVFPFIFMVQDCFWIVLPRENQTATAALATENSLKKT